MRLEKARHIAQTRIADPLPRLLSALLAAASPAAPAAPGKAAAKKGDDMNTTRIMVLAALVAGGGWALQAARAQQPGVRRTDLQRHDLGIPGREVVQVRVDLAPGVASGRHSHPGEEIVYVIEGSLEYEVEGRPPVTLKAGEVLFIPAGAVHAAKNVGADNGAELATYVVEKGKPLVVMAE